MPDLSQARVGVIGGSGLYSIPGLRQVEERTVDTPFGTPSDQLRLGELEGVETVFLARHGRHHHLLPSEVPYRANIWAMRSLGVRWLISLSAVGSLQEHLQPRDMVVPDQFIDRTRDRPASFFGNGCVAHVSLADPFCPNLSALLADAAEQGCRRVDGCTAVAPISAWRARLLHPGRKQAVPLLGLFGDRDDQSHRSRLAREAELAYASLSMVTDFDCWHEDHDAVSVEMVIGNLQANASATEPILSGLMQRLKQDPPASPAHTALANALNTPKDQDPAQTRSNHYLVTAPYWGPFDQASAS